VEGILRLAVEEEQVLLRKASRDGREAELASAAGRCRGTAKRRTWLQKGPAEKTSLRADAWEAQLPPSPLPVASLEQAARCLGETWDFTTSSSH